MSDPEAKAAAPPEEEEHNNSSSSSSSSSSSTDAVAAASGGGAADPVDPNAVRAGRTNQQWAEIYAEIEAGNLDYLHPCEEEALAKLRDEGKELLSDPFWQPSYRQKFIIACLFARKLDVKRTLELLTNHLNFRKEKKLLDPIVFEDLNEKLVHSKYTVVIPGGRDKKHRSVGYIIIRNFFPAQYKSQDVIKYATFLFEYIVHHEPLSMQREGITYIEDLDGFGWSNMDNSMSKELSNAMLANFPLRIQSILIVNPGFFFRMLIAIAKFFMSSKIVQRVEPIKKELLLERVDPEHLWDQYGGNLSYDHDAFINGLKEFAALQQSEAQENAKQEAEEQQ